MNYDILICMIERKIGTDDNEYAVWSVYIYAVLKVKILTVQIHKREFRNMVVLFPGRVGEHSGFAVCTAGKPV